MKKYLLGLFAIVLAIGFSSFTAMNKQKSKALESPLYWYDVSSTGQITSSIFIHDERDNVKAMGGDCVKDSGTLCKLGFENEVDPADFDSPPASSDDLRKDTK